MFKIIDIVGFRTTSSTFGMIRKIKNYQTKKIEFLLTFIHDFYDDDMYYINNNTKDISKFFNVLKNNGSCLITYKPNEIELVGKKLLDITKSAKIYSLCEFNNEPLIEFDNVNFPPTELSLTELFNEQRREVDLSFLN